MKKTALSFGMGILGAACLPYAGWVNHVYDATPYTFLPFSLSLAVLFDLLTRAPVGRFHVFIRSYAWALGYFLFSLNWVGNALLVFGGAELAWMWPLAFVGIPLLLAFFLATTMTIVASWLWRAPASIQIILFAGFFTLAEYLRGHLFTGFPWSLPGMFWAETLDIFQSLAWIGIYGLSFLTLLWGTTLGSLILRRTPLYSLPVLLSILTVGGLLLLPPPNLPQNDPKKTVQILVVQADIQQNEKWNEDNLVENFKTYLNLSARTESNITNDHPAIIVWPETTLPPNFLHSTWVTQQITQMLADYPPNSVLVTGVMRGENTPHNEPIHYNSVAVYDQKSQVSIVYDKHHLVPFGEYVPFRRYIPLLPIIQFEGLGAGTSGPRTIQLPGLPSFSPLVCYEILFSGQVTAPTGPHPQLILNFTNDAWFDNSPGPYQHLMEARARAIEERIPVVRAAGTGISVVFNARGEALNILGYNQKGKILTSLSFR